MGSEDKPIVNRKLITALSCFVGLAILAFFTLDGVLRIATWIFLGGFAIKTVLVALRQRED